MTIRRDEYITMIDLMIWLSEKERENKKRQVTDDDDEPAPLTDR